MMPSTRAVSAPIEANVTATTVSPPETTMNSSLPTNQTTFSTAWFDEGNSSFLGLTQAEVVVVGAVTTVLILALLAVILRLIMPRIRRKLDNKPKVIPKKEIVDERSGKLLAPGTPSSQTSRSSSRCSSRQGDWSDSASDRTKSTYFSQSSLLPKSSAVFGNYKSQGIASPVYLPDGSEKSQSRNDSRERLNENLMFVIRDQTHVLEPINLGNNYRQNWDRTFDAETPSTGLSYLSHPSENPHLPEGYSTYPLRHHWSRARIGEIEVNSARNIPQTKL